MMQDSPTVAHPVPPPTSTQILAQWILDTRPLWPDATETRHLAQCATEALNLLTPPEQAAVLRFYHLRDAKLSLASHLIKRHVISHFCRVPWREAIPSRHPLTSKPIWQDPTTSDESIVFNVSHQAGLVALIAIYDPHRKRKDKRPADVGVDVVCTSERRQRDHSAIAAGPRGWEKFIDMHADVLSPREVESLKHGLPEQQANPSSETSSGGDEAADYKLRYFYSLWCLREAYVKMTGEALVAPWLADLEFRNFTPPKPVVSDDPLGQSGNAPAEVGTDLRPGDDGQGQGRSRITQHEIYFKDVQVEGVKMSLTALGPDYMAAVAVRPHDEFSEALESKLGIFEQISLEHILAGVKESEGQ